MGPLKVGDIATLCGHLLATEEHFAFACATKFIPHTTLTTHTRRIRAIKLQKSIQMSDRPTESQRSYDSQWILDTHNQTVHSHVV
jgi:hypothetical protein